MYDIDTKLESENCLIAIEEYAKDIEDRLNIIDQGMGIIESLESRMGIYKETLSKESMNEDYLSLALEDFKVKLDILGCTMDLGLEDLDLVEKANKLIVSHESLGADVWTAIKKIMEGIWKAISGMYASIKKFFGIEKSKIEDDVKRIDSLKDLNDFEIDKKLTGALLKKYKTRLPIFMSLGLDLSSKSDLESYSNLIKANNWPLVNYELFIKGSSNDKSSELQYDQAFKLLGNKSDKVFSNVNGILTKDYKSKVNGHFVTGVGVNEGYMVSLFKTAEGATKLINNTLVVDKEAIDKNTKSNLSKLNKKVLNSLTDIRSDLIDKESQFEKDANNFKKKMEDFYNGLAKDGKGSKELYNGNLKVMGNILSKSVGSLVKHVPILDSLTDDFIKIYEKAGSK